MTEKEWIDGKIDDAERSYNSLTLVLLTAASENLVARRISFNEAMRELSDDSVKFVCDKYDTLSESEALSECYDDNFGEISSVFDEMSDSGNIEPSELFLHWDKSCGGCNTHNRNLVLSSVIQKISDKIIVEFQLAKEQGIIKPATGRSR